ncbi:MAG TPA: ABC transporter substrate-binding protein [Alphaproteobacteria bacterium]|nr:ABC transporter substrate-binding protein [Alphaproteobacteria bacterium]
MRRLALSVIGFVLAVAASGVSAQAAELTKLRVGWCARTVSSAASPFAIATKLGWYARAGIKVELVPMPGSTDCVKTVATGDLPFSLPSVEPLATIRSQGVKARIFYTAYEGNIYGIAVPKDSPIKGVQDLRGKRIGVQSMASGGVQVARALLAMGGMDPDKDAQIVVIGEAAQAAALVRSKQADALSLYDTQYALIENAGVPLRMLDTGPIAKYPSNGFLALEETLQKHRKWTVALAKGYAMGTVFAMANPEAAVRIMYEMYPQTRPTGKSEAEAVRDDVKALEAREHAWRLESGGVKRWGESSPANYAAYIDFLLKWKVIKQKVAADDLITNDLIADINTFDPAKIAAEAKAYKAK